MVCDRKEHKQVAVPAAFRWLSLTGSLRLLSYTLFHDRDSVFIFACAFTWIPYTRNLVIHRRREAAHLSCPSCRRQCPPLSRFCFACGTPLTVGGARASA
jgi:hypothetical protein